MSAAPPRRTWRRHALAALLLLSAGVALPWFLPFAPAQKGGPGLAGYDHRVRDGFYLLGRLDQAHNSGPQSVSSAVSVVHGAFRHGDPPRLDPRWNWLRWTLGLAWRDLHLTQHPEFLAAGGQGLCSEAVLVLNELVHRSLPGAEARMVDLTGHVVAEIDWRGRTWTADPDFGLTFEGGWRDVARRPDAIEAAVLAAGHGAERAALVVQAYTSLGDNGVVPAGVLHPRLWAVERGLDAVVVLGPMLWLLGALTVGFRGRRRAG